MCASEAANDVKVGTEDDLAVEATRRLLVAIVNDQLQESFLGVLAEVGDVLGEAADWLAVLLETVFDVTLYADMALTSRHVLVVLFRCFDIANVKHVVPRGGGDTFVPAQGRKLQLRLNLDRPSKVHMTLGALEFGQINTFQDLAILGPLDSIRRLVLHFEAVPWQLFVLHIDLANPLDFTDAVAQISDVECNFVAALNGLWRTVLVHFHVLLQLNRFQVPDSVEACRVSLLGEDSRSARSDQPQIALNGLWRTVLVKFLFFSSLNGFKLLGHRFEVRDDPRRVVADIVAHFKDLAVEDGDVFAWETFRKCLLVTHFNLSGICLLHVIWDGFSQIDHSLNYN